MCCTARCRSVGALDSASHTHTLAHAHTQSGQRFNVIAFSDAPTSWKPDVVAFDASAAGKRPKKAERECSSLLSCARRRPTIRQRTATRRQRESNGGARAGVFGLDCRRRRRRLGQLSRFARAQHARELFRLMSIIYDCCCWVLLSSSRSLLLARDAQRHARVVGQRQARAELGLLTGGAGAARCQRPRIERALFSTLLRPALPSRIRWRRAIWCVAGIATFAFQLAARAPLRAARVGGRRQRHHAHQCLIGCVCMCCVCTRAHVRARVKNETLATTNARRVQQTLARLFSLVVATSDDAELVATSHVCDSRSLFLFSTSIVSLFCFAFMNTLDSSDTQHQLFVQSTGARQEEGARLTLPPNAGDQHGHGERADQQTMSSAQVQK